MIRPLATAAALSLAALPVAATAQDVTLSFGVAITSDYISRGLSQTGGRPAIQPYAEVGLAGFYAGIWASNVRFPGDRDRVEVDLYVGFANEVGQFSYDIGYARYFYDRSGNCCGEILLSLGTEAPFGASFSTDLAYDPSAEIWAGSLGAAYSFDGGLTVSAEVGRQQSSHNFWNLGLGMEVNEFTGLDLRVHDTNVTGARLVASVFFDF